MKGIVTILIAFSIVSCASNAPKSTKDKKADLYYGHGTQKLIERDYTEALKNLMKANDFRPNDTRILNNLGMAYFLKGQKHIAINYFKKSIDINEKNADARNNLASVYFTMKKYDKAEEQYKKVLENLLYRNNFRVFYNLALIEMKRNNTAKAISFLEKASGHKADYCAANFLLAKTYQKQRNISKALQWYKRSTSEKCSNNPQPFYEWANLLSQLGQDDIAIEKYSLIVEKFPKNKLSLHSQRKIKMIQRELMMTKKSINRSSINTGEF